VASRISWLTVVSTLRLLDNLSSTEASALEACSGASLMDWSQLSSSSSPLLSKSCLAPCFTFSSCLETILEIWIFSLALIDLLPHLGSTKWTTSKMRVELTMIGGDLASERLKLSWSTAYFPVKHAEFARNIGERRLRSGPLQIHQPCLELVEKVPVRV
jgi:hypothetical protein